MKFGVVDLRVVNHVVQHDTGILQFLFQFFARRFNVISLDLLLALSCFCPFQLFYLPLNALDDTQNLLPL
jgi:hypothetical protein